MRKLFYQIGWLIGRYPLIFAVLGVSLSFSALGIFEIHLKDQIRDGYTPDNAPSKLEMIKMREFWNATGDPILTTFFVQAKNKTDGNIGMLSLARLNETIQLVHFFMDGFRVSLDGGKTAFTYSQLCYPYCDANWHLEIFVDGLETEIDALKTKNDSLVSENVSSKNSASNLKNSLKYPIAKAFSFDVHLERFFFGVKVKNSQQESSSSSPKSSQPAEVQVTNMKSIELVSFAFRGDRSSPLLDQQFSAWELAVFDYLTQNYTNEIIDVKVVGSEILDKEMMGEGKKIIPFFAAGFILMLLFVVFNIFGTARFFGKFDAGKILIAGATIFCPVLAIISTYGLMGLFNIRVNSFLLLLPYLVLGIGVDDGFLLIHKWLATSHIRPDLRMAIVFKEVGPSITLTTLTNVISFGIGAFTPTLEIRLFCFGTALALTLDFFLQVILFCPILLYSARFEGRQKGTNTVDAAQTIAFMPVNGFQSHNTGKKKIRKYRLVEDLGWPRRAFDFYCHLLTSKYFTILLLLLMGIYWYFAAIGVLQIQTRLDAKKILPKNSVIHESVRLLEEYVWGSNYYASILVNGRLNISDPKEYGLFKQMLHEFETLPHSRGAKFSLVWLNDYERFFTDSDDSEARIEALFQLVQKSGKGLTEPNSFRRFRRGILAAGNNEQNLINSSVQANSLNYCKLEEFLDSPFYNHWSSFIRREEDDTGCAGPSTFYVTVAFENSSTWESRIELVQKWREITSRYFTPNWSVITWEQGAMFVDQMLSLKGVAYQSVLLTLCSMAVICAIFIPDPFSVLIASFSIVSISLGVFGFLSWFGFDLDPITLAALLMSIGLSVDFTAHVTYHFRSDHREEWLDNQKCIHVPLKTRHERLRYTLESVAWPSIQSGLSTALCITPIFLRFKYTTWTFVTTIYLVCGLGLIHGLVILPCLLSALPDCLVTTAQKLCFCCTRNRERRRFNIASSTGISSLNTSITGLSYDLNGLPLASMVKNKNAHQMKTNGKNLSGSIKLNSLTYKSSDQL